MDDLGEVVFDLSFPVEDEAIRQQVAAALALGLPEADAAAIETLRVIANGPSALGAPLDGPTMAVNGAIRLFTAKGLAPTFWACCDPQALVADFLDIVPDETVYLVASKCHPAVFDRLKGRDVRLWHIEDVPGRRNVPTASTVTLCAIALMRRLGWRRFETWGWDACFLDGMDHASAQPIGKINLVTVTIGDKAFHTTPAWAVEAQDAWRQLAMADYEVDVRGPGLVAEMLSFQGVSPHPTEDQNR